MTTNPVTLSEHLHLSGYNAMIASFCELVDHVASLEQRITQLEYLVTEELMLEPAPRTQPSRNRQEGQEIT
jgi:hypothetical protein